MPSFAHCRELLQKHLQGTITEPERQELYELLSGGEMPETWTTLISELSFEGRWKAPYDAEQWEPMIRAILATPVEEPAPVIPMRRRSPGWVWAAAAAIIIMLGAGGFWWFTQEQTNKETPVVMAPADKDPGKNGAVLTLANGAQVVLDSLGNGLVATQNGARLMLMDGQLSYDVTTATPGSLVYNTISTPYGRQFHLVLPDSTNVWLNAGSSITYPTAFISSERKVTVTGEVYFEVAKNKAKPFKVNVNDQSQIEVLGTHFNVNAYPDDAVISTTLLEGRIKISAASTGVILQPGQQAQQTPDQKIILVENADLQSVMAWKNGLFYFNGNEIKSVMREIGRWYDLEVIYEAEPGPRKISGKMQRSLSLSQAMKILKDLDINYRLEGRKLIIVK